MASVKVFKGDNSGYKGGYQNSSISNVFNVPYSLTSEQVGAQAGATNTTALVYQVPAGYTLFITSCTLNVINNNAVVGVNERGRLYFQSQLIMRIYSGGIINNSVANSMSFPFPYILRSNENVYVQGESAGGLTQASIVGFLVRNADLEQK